MAAGPPVCRRVEDFRESNRTKLSYAYFNGITEKHAYRLPGDTYRKWKLPAHQVDSFWPELSGYDQLRPGLFIEAG